MTFEIKMTSHNQKGLAVLKFDSYKPEEEWLGKHTAKILIIK